MMFCGLGSPALSAIASNSPLYMHPTRDERYHIMPTDQAMYWAAMAPPLSSPVFPSQPSSAIPSPTTLSPSGTTTPTRVSPRSSPRASPSRKSYQQQHFFPKEMPMDVDSPASSAATLVRSTPHMAADQQEEIEDQESLFDPVTRTPLSLTVEEKECLAEGTVFEETTTMAAAAVANPIASLQAGQKPLAEGIHAAFFSPDVTFAIPPHAVNSPRYMPSKMMTTKQKTDVPAPKHVEAGDTDAATLKPRLLRKIPRYGSMGSLSVALSTPESCASMTASPPAMASLAGCLSSSTTTSRKRHATRPLHPDDLIECRMAKTDDIRAVDALWSRYNPSLTEEKEERLEVFQSLLAMGVKDHTPSYIAKYENNVIACILAYPHSTREKDVLKFSQLYIDQTQKGYRKAIAKRLFTFLITEAQKQHVAHVMVQVCRSMPPIPVSVYEHLGFERQDNLSTYSHYIYLKHI